MLWLFFNRRLEPCKSTDLFSDRAVLLTSRFRFFSLSSPLISPTGVAYAHTKKKGRMKSLFRHCFLAATVTLVIALSADVVACVVTTRDFTADQHANTLTVLTALSLGAVGLPSAAASADFCTWPGIACHRLGSGDVGVEVTLTQDLPIRLSPEVQLSQVRITALNVRVSTLSEDSTFLSDLAQFASSPLTVLDFTSSNITSMLPDVWGTFTNLQHLRLGNNNFYGTMPDAWMSLTSLIELQLYNNNVTGTLPASWRTLTKLQDVTLDNNLLFGTLPPSWSAMATLRRLSLAGNAFCGGVPDSWASMKQLSLTANEGLYDECVASSASTSSHPTRTTTTTSANEPPSGGISSTTEPPAVLTNCKTPHCVLCPITAPTRCAACMPGYALTSYRTCSARDRNGMCGPAGLWQLAVACVVPLIAFLSLI